MNSLVIQYIPIFAIFLISILVPIGITLWIRHQRKNRRNPLTTQMLRAPGESIAKRIEVLNEDVDLYFSFSTIVPLLCYSMYLSSKYVAKAQTSPSIFVVIAVSFMGFFWVRLNKAIRQRHNECLGLDCERAVGEELNQLLLDGCRVFHDFQADKFNIDHIVISENGVFAIETKGRAKPDRGRGQEDVKVVYDGQALQFPTWREHEPLEQAKRQAAWLSSWLTRAVGEHIAVKPALALPGWFVERKKPDFLIFSGKNPQFITKIKTVTSLSPELIQRVAHQVEQQCRDVVPQAYKKVT